jgi:methylated-DNA-[protein]-cysteine S-methyltransferase
MSMRCASGSTNVSYRMIDTPVGPLLLAATSTGLVRIAYVNEGRDQVLSQLSEHVGPRVCYEPARLDNAAFEIDQYFAGRRRRFGLALDLRLVHGFRHAVLNCLVHIPYGATMSYAEVAVAAGSPKATRAVGSACATNPLPIVVPCHRVLRSDGTLGGYAAGLDVKRALLDLEASDAPSGSPK